MGGACIAYGGGDRHIIIFINCNWVITRWQWLFIYTGFWWGNLRERDNLGDPGIDGRIILRWIFRKWDVGLWTGSSWLRLGTNGGHL
jgi:hypothetical protein